MIAYVEGRIAETTETSCIIVCSGGVGYEVFLPQHTLAKTITEGNQAFFYTNTVVREDALELFGFETWDERQTFLVLTSINRIGARTALSILSVYRPDDLRQIVTLDDPNALTKVPGIGKKTAQQVFLELKYKLKPLGIGIQTAKNAIPPQQHHVFHDAVAGLLNLGYDEEQSRTTVQHIIADEPDLDVSSILRASLKLLAKSR